MRGAWIEHDLQAKSFFLRIYGQSDEKNRENLAVTGMTLNITGIGIKVDFRIISEFNKVPMNFKHNVFHLPHTPRWRRSFTNIQAQSVIHKYVTLSVKPLPSKSQLTCDRSLTYYLMPGSGACTWCRALRGPQHKDRPPSRVVR